jgi:hypothetical protein
VVAHDRKSLPLLDHGPNDLKHLPNLRATVDEVAKKDHLAFVVAVDTLGFLVTESFKQLYQFIGVAVNVADQVVQEILLFRLPLDLSDLADQVSHFVPIQFGNRRNSVDVADQVFLSTQEGRATRLSLGTPYHVAFG